MQAMAAPSARLDFPVPGEGLGPVPLRRRPKAIGLMPEGKRCSTSIAAIVPAVRVAEAEGSQPPGLEFVSGPPHPFCLHAPAGRGVNPASSPTAATRPPPALPG